MISTRLTGPRLSTDSALSRFTNSSYSLYLYEILYLLYDVACECLIWLEWAFKLSLFDSFVLPSFLFPSWPDDFISAVSPIFL